MQRYAWPLIQADFQSTTKKFYPALVKSCLEETCFVLLINLGCVNLEVSSVKDTPSYGTLRSLEASLNPQLTKYARETEMSISQARRENRNLLFNLCPFQPVSYCFSIGYVYLYLTLFYWFLFKFLGASDVLMQTGSKTEPFEESFGHRFFTRVESINFRLQAPIDGDKGPLGQVSKPYFNVSCGFLFIFYFSSKLRYR